VGADGQLVLLADQDRSRWDRTLIAEGQELVRRCLRRNRPGPYQVQAAINAVHSDATSAADTDWRQIVQLYDHLMVLAPSPVVELNRAVAVAEVDGPEAGLAALDGLDLPRNHLLPAVRADLLRRLGRRTEADAAYAEALELVGNDAGAAFLRRRRTELLSPSGGGSA
jgi:RNA polymerase sigma-70 factor (ECF subfamily)